jgi:plasmid stabilization system protein ParE
MARRIIWTETAWCDLEELADYIAKDSSFYAAAFVCEVLDASRSLTYFAERGRIVPEFGDQTIRELLVRRYRLIYKIAKDIVYILGFIHGARDLQKLWKKSGRRDSDKEEK